MSLSAVAIRSRRCCLGAGSSALILAYAHFHAELWFLAFVGLIPFLSQLCRAPKREALLTGMVLAGFYVLATSFGDLLTAPKIFLFKFLVLNIVFGFLSLAITWLRSRRSFEPVVIALLTVPVTLAFCRLVNVERLFSMMQAGTHIAVSMYSLVSILLWSAVVILGNSLILFFARSILAGLRFSGRFRRRRQHYLRVLAASLSRRRIWRCLPDPRAPPLSPVRG